MRFIDLFAGIGGFHYGIEKANKHQSVRERAIRKCLQRQGDISSNNVRRGKPEQISTKRHRLFNGEYRCVYSNEWDKYAAQIYKKHYGECDTRDIRTVKSSEIPDFDLLCGGFPCQSFSIAGKRRGFDDTRGTLFFDIARILREKKPRLCLLENVKGLLSHDEGRTIKTIFATLDELGYDLQWQVCNSKDFGVPQNRERIFIIGHLRGTPRPKVFPIGEQDKMDTQPEQYAEKQIASCLQSGEGSHIANGEYKGMNVVQRVPLKFLQRNQKNIEGDYSFTVDGVNTGGVKQDMRIRRLTPIECERLQGFPDNWTQYGADGELISDTQRYKMCGNAVTTNVITEITRRLA